MLVRLLSAGYSLRSRSKTKDRKSSLSKRNRIHQNSCGAISYQTLEDRRLLAVDVSGSIATDTAWNSPEGYRLVGDVSVEDGATLTIQVDSPTSVVSTLDDFALQVEAGGTLVINNTNFKGVTNQIVASPGSTLEIFDSSFHGQSIQLADGTAGTISNSTLSGIEAFHSLVIDSGSSVAFSSNSILFESIVATGDAGESIDLSNNHWGTSDVEEIASRIVDQTDDPALPAVDFSAMQAAPKALDVVLGTAGDDVFVIDLTSGNPVVSVNGNEVEFTPAHAGMRIDGLGGEDSVTVNLGNSSETVTMTPDQTGITGFRYATGISTASDWTTYQGNEGHTGQVNAELLSDNFSVDWTRKFDRPLQQVTAADGKVFVSAEVRFNPEEQFFTLDASNGETLWAKNFGSVNSVNAPSFAYGNVYLQTGNHGGDTFLRAYEADSGDLVFRSPHGAQWERYFAPTISDGTVFINGGTYGGMYSFDALTGDQNWFADLPQYDKWTPAVDDTYAYAFVGEYSPGLYVLDRDTGELAFRIDDPNFDWSGWSMNTAPVLGNNNVLGIHNGRLISFDIENQDINWEKARAYTGTPIVSETGQIYSIDGGSFVALSEEDGSPLWSWESPSENLYGTALITENLFFVRSSTTTYAVDLETREEVWSIEQSGEMTWSEGKLYIASNDGTLTAISAQEDIFSNASNLLTLSNFETTTLNSGGGNDSVVFFDSEGDDSFYADLNYALMSGNGFTNRANNFEIVRGLATDGGEDTADLTLRDGDEFFVFRDGRGGIRGAGEIVEASGFENYKAQGITGSDSRAVLWGDDGDNRFTRRLSWATMSTGDADVSVFDFARVTAYGNGGDDVANVQDSLQDDNFISRPGESFWSNSGGTFVSAFDFNRITTMSLAGNDSGVIVGSTNKDSFFGSEESGTLKTEDGIVYAVDFERLTAWSSGGGDAAYLTGPADSSIRFVGNESGARILNDDFFLNTKGFANVVARSNSSDDTAYLSDSPGEDILVATPDYVRLTNTGSGMAMTTLGFENVYSNSSQGVDRAFFRDSVGDDQFTLRPNSTLMRGDNYLRFATGYASVSAVASEGEDIVRLFDSTGDDQLFMNPQGTTLKGLDFRLYGRGFDRTVIVSLGGNDEAVVEDSDSNDLLFATGNDAWMYDSERTFFRKISGFETVLAVSKNGGSDSANLEETDFGMNLLGDWAE
jgi:hypothetical protein